ncbi:MAG TPA: membrane dipeptidase, partial [Polyangiaceae bacterium]
ALVPIYPPLSEADQCNAERHGHKNALGLTATGKRQMEALMEAGLMIDVSHMSDTSTNDTIELLTHTKFQYPVMSSHTGIRMVDTPLTDAQKSARGPLLTERELNKGQVRKIAASGGVLGVGTAGDTQERVLTDLMGGELAQLGSPETPNFSWSLRDRKLFPENTRVRRLDFTLRAGYDGKRDCSRLTLSARLRSGAVVSSTALNGREIPAYSWSSRVSLTLSDVPLSEIVGIELDFDAQGQCVPAQGPDIFTLLDLKVHWSGANGEGGTPLLQRTASVESQGSRNGYYVRLDLANPRLVEPLRWSADERFLSEEVLRLRVRMAPFSCQRNSFARFTIGTSDSCFSPEVSIPVTACAPIGAPPLPMEGTFEFAGARQSNGSRFTVADVLSVALTQTTASVESLTIEVDTPSGTHELVTHRGRPFIGSTRSGRDLVVYEAGDDCKALSLDDPARTVLVHLKTGDDLPSGTDPLVVRICKPDFYCGRTLVNPSAPWEGSFLAAGGVVTVAVQMRDDFKVRDLVSLEIEANSGWDLDRITVSIPTDPLDKWVKHYRDALGLMNGRGVALGTDLNGLQHQLAFTSYDPGYPFAVPGPSGAAVKTLSQHTIGDRVLDFRKDGLAHYGMLADMVSAVRKVQYGQDSADRLFRSAEDVIRMWERIQPRKEVFVQRSTSPCEAFGPANTEKAVSGVACQTLSAAPGVFVPQYRQIQVVNDVGPAAAPPLSGDGFLDVYVSGGCFGGSSVPVRIQERNQWTLLPFPIMPGCPLTLRFQAEPDHTYTVMHRQFQ